MLLALWRECPDALAADFNRYYGDSPARLLARGVPLLEVAGNARWLPTEAAVWRAVSPPSPEDAWGLTEHLLAIIADRLAWISYVQQKVAGGKPQKPKNIPRPGVVGSETNTYGKDALPMDEMAEWLGWATAAEGDPSSASHPTTAPSTDPPGPDTSRPEGPGEPG